MRFTEQAFKSYQAMPFGMVLEVTPPTPRWASLPSSLNMEMWTFKVTADIGGSSTFVTKELVDFPSNVANRYDWVVASLVSELIHKGIIGYGESAVAECKAKMNEVAL